MSVTIAKCPKQKSKFSPARGGNVCAHMKIPKCWENLKALLKSRIEAPMCLISIHWIVKNGVVFLWGQRKCLDFNLCRRNGKGGASRNYPFCFSDCWQPEVVTKGRVVSDSLVWISPLVRQSTRLVFSNVYLEIPDDVLASNITDFCDIVSPIWPIPPGMKGKFAHVMSFRRQVHVLIISKHYHPEPYASYAEGHYRIFLSTDNVKCFACGERGHTHTKM